MHRSLLKKSLHETKLLLFGCALWLFAFSWARVWIVSRMEQGRFQAILEQIGDVVSRFSPVPIAHLVSFPGRIAIVFDEPLVAFTIFAFAIARGSDVVSGELNRGTLEMLLAQPVSRTQVLTSQALVTTVGLVLLSIAVWAGTATGVYATQAKIAKQASFELPLKVKIPLPFLEARVENVPMRKVVDPAVFWPAAVNLFCVGFTFAGGASLLSAVDRYRWRTVGLSIAALVLLIVIKVFGVALKNNLVLYCTFMTAFEPQQLVEIACNRPEYAWSFTLPVAEGNWKWGPLAYDGALVGLGVSFYAAALAIFVRRDLPAPL